MHAVERKGELGESDGLKTFVCVNVNVNKCVCARACVFVCGWVCARVCACV